MIEKISNRICMLLYRREYRHFNRYQDTKKVQESILTDLIKTNAHTQFGRKYGFENIKKYSDFAERVPISEYASYTAYIDEIASGNQEVLTQEPVKLFELTSGSGGEKKLIPYTERLREEFCNGIKPWLYDIYKNCKGVRNGKSYWSITPVLTGKKYSECGIPIGFEDDTEYFGKIESFFVGKTFAVDSSIKFCNNMEEFYFKTCKQLLECKNLTLISVWSPTFLIVMMDYIKNNAKKLLGNTKKDTVRLEYISDGRFEKVFDKLKIISCWCDGNAKHYQTELRQRFKGVFIQPKGLLSTESFTSFPIIGVEGSFLSIYSHFFEFRNIENEEIVLACELEIKKKYEVIVTTGGGFYRYSTKDVIEVLSVKRGIPVIRFSGRADRISDLFGEKIDESFVSKIIDNLGIKGFAMVAPEKDKYVLYLDSKGFSDIITKGESAVELFEKELLANFHYSYCRQLNQLKKSHVFLIKENAEKLYLGRYQESGMRLGDIKMNRLSLDSEWDTFFNGDFL